MPHQHNDVELEVDWTNLGFAFAGSELLILLSNLLPSIVIELVEGQPRLLEHKTFQH